MTPLIPLDSSKDISSPGWTEQASDAAGLGHLLHSLMVLLLVLGEHSAL